MAHRVLGLEREDTRIEGTQVSGGGLYTQGWRWIRARVPLLETADGYAISSDSIGLHRNFALAIELERTCRRGCCFGLINVRLEVPPPLYPKTKNGERYTARVLLCTRLPRGICLLFSVLLSYCHWSQ